MKIRNLMLASVAGLAIAGYCVFPAAAQDTGDATIHNTTNSVEHPYRARSGGTGLVPMRPRPDRHYVFVAVPGGTAGKWPYPYNGEGVVILDADHDYEFVKRLTWDDTPIGKEAPEASGITANVALNMLYVETRNGLRAFDLATGKQIWHQIYGGDAPKGFQHAVEGPAECCERAELTPDGKTLVMGANLNNFWYVVDAATGNLKGKINTPDTVDSHNMGLSPDGKTVFMSSGTHATMSIADLDTMKVIKTVKFSEAVRPFVINHDATRIYANVDDLLGVEIADVKTGKVVKRIEAPAEMWKAKWADPNQHFYGHGCPSHGIALTPDESELWVVDNINDNVLVYDNTGDWPVLNQSKSFKTTADASWITMGLDGKKAFMGSGDVIDVKTHKIITTLKDEYGHVMHSEKVLELAFQDGKLVQSESQFGEGVPAAVAARLNGKLAQN